METQTVRFTPKRWQTASSSRFILTITERKQLDYAGTLTHECTGRELQVASLFEACLMIQKVLGEVGFLEPNFRLRSWSKQQAVRPDQQDGRGESESVGRNMSEKRVVPAEDVETITTPTFVVQVLRENNATWQGTIQWIDKQRTLHFRSVLELIKLMEDAVAQCDVPHDDTEEQDW